MIMKSPVEYCVAAGRIRFWKKKFKSTVGLIKDNLEI